jgi:blue copper oxidase
MDMGGSGIAMKGDSGMKGAGMAMAMPEGTDPAMVQRVVELVTEGPALPLDQQLAANTVNGAPFAMGVVPFGAAIDRDLRWLIAEKTDRMLHPVHIHGCQFRILGLNGKAPPACMAGWKDTAPIENGGSCEIQVRFEHPAAKQAPFMAHCHNLEHEDSGMMTSFTVS